MTPALEPLFLSTFLVALIPSPSSKCAIYTLGLPNGYPAWTSILNLTSDQTLHVDVIETSQVYHVQNKLLVFPEHLLRCRLPHVSGYVHPVVVLLDIFLLSCCSAAPSANSIDSAFQHVRIDYSFTTSTPATISLH